MPILDIELSARYLVSPPDLASDGGVCFTIIYNSVQIIIRISLNICTSRCYIGIVVRKDQTT